ncbi:MAG: hypothetical protein M3041_02035 [Acidobacteriota bacterium]|nr:hypothetical protein [Acidobacteriota bacterium]
MMWAASVRADVKSVRVDLRRRKKPSLHGAREIELLLREFVLPQSRLRREQTIFAFLIVMEDESDDARDQHGRRNRVDEVKRVETEVTLLRSV